MLKIRHICVNIIVIIILISFTYPVNVVAENNKSNSSINHTYIIVYKDPIVDKDSIPGALNHYSNPVPGALKYNYNIINAQAVEIPDSLVNTIMARGDVKYIVPDMQVHADLSDVVNLINATAPRSLGYTGKGVNVSVIDSGIDDTHPDLQGKVILWKDFLNNNSTPYDDYGHGTHVAGIIAGSGNASNGSYKGIANGANLFCAKILNSSGVASTSDMIAAIDWSAKNHADIISMSLSITNHYQPLEDAVHNAVAGGVIVVCSAGNLGPNPGTMKSPSDSPDTIAVGSIDKSDNLSSFSSRGPTSDGRTKPDIVAVGESVISARATGTSMGSPINKYYTSLSGTSMSCPQVSAACAILLEADHSLKPIDVKNALLGTADRMSPVYPNNDTGWGRLNVGAALSEVLSGTIVPPVPSGTVPPTKFTIDLNTSWNLVSLPLLNDTLWASQLGGYGVRRVSSYNKSTGGYDTYVMGFSSADKDIKIKTDNAYFLETTNKTSLSLYGVLYDPHNVTVNPGWNAVGWSSLSTIKASDLGNRSSDIQRICEYNSSAMAYDTYVLWFSSSDKNFNVTPGKGYFIYLNATTPKALKLG